MSDAKAKVRKGTLFNRRMLAEPVWRHRCDLVVDRALDFVNDRGLRCVHLFLPISKNQEIDTWPLLKKLHQMGVQILLSQTDFEKQEMQHVIYEPEISFKEDRFGIPTPVTKANVFITQADLIFIPLLAADKKGNRVGYGKGFYDRLLVDARPDSLKVGLSISPPFDQFSFAEPHDFRLDFLITPYEVLNCHD